MTLAILRLLIDFGLFVLIWIVQLVVYPGFKYYPRPALLAWHQQYTTRISAIVFPLMLGQLIIVGLQLWGSVDWYTLSSFLFVLLLWGSTFGYFVGLHSDIGNGSFNKDTLQLLEQKNWWRTALWTALFILAIIDFVQ